MRRWVSWAIALLVFCSFIPVVSASPLALSTSTVTGFAIPNAAGLNNGIFSLLIPVVIAGLLLSLMAMIGVEGELNSFIIKLGLMVGGLLGMLSVSSAPATIIPFAIPVVCAIFLVTYMWKKV
jgi:hypothetical protein